MVEVVRSSSVRVVVAAAMVSLLSIAGAVAVAAHSSPDNMYPGPNSASCQDGLFNGNGYCRADNSTHTFWIDDGAGASINATGATRIRNLLTNELAGTTDMTVAEHATAVTSGSAETDVLYINWDIFVPSGSNAIVYCDDAVNGTKCDQHYAFFKVSAPPTTTICHETAHTVGLQHGLDANPSVSDTTWYLGCIKNPSDRTTLYAHQRHQINSTY